MKVSPQPAKPWRNFPNESYRQIERQTSLSEAPHLRYLRHRGVGAQRQSGNDLRDMFKQKKRQIQTEDRPYQRLSKAVLILRQAVLHGPIARCEVLLGDMPK